MSNFYDRVAKEFGGYGFSNSEPKYRSVFIDIDPEKLFKKLIIDNSNVTNTALDIGCGDGKFSFQIAKYFKQLTGLDSSRGLIDIANKKLIEYDTNNIEFIFGNASKMPIKSGSINLAFNRRGPSFYKEYYRILKVKGLYIEIGIGEKDAMPLKQIFKRGQNYGDWIKERTDLDTKTFKDLGFNVKSAINVFYKEFYKNKDEFSLFLRGVPIFEDFDPAKDKELLESYYAKFELQTGEIELDRHRVVYLLEKL